MKFKTNVASAAVAAALGLMAGSAQAVYMSEDGTGQVLIYPYYTVQNGYDTYVSVVNTKGTAKAVKVRVLEGKASVEVLDFNLYLSPYDVWTAAITTATGATSASGGLLRTNDTSCTAPQITGDVLFRNLAYSGNDSFENAMSRTREGYIEMIEMGVPDNLDLVNAATPTRPAQTFAWSVTHDKATGKPADCAWVSAQWTKFGATAGGTTGTLKVGVPSGGLFGSATLINVAQGTDYSYDPTVLDAFSSSRGLHSLPGTTSPSLKNADPISAVIQSTTAGQQSVITDWFAVGGALGISKAGAGIDAVNAVLIRGAVMNEYALDTAINATTDWVVTFPTKRNGVTSTTAYAPWTVPFGDLKNSSGVVTGFTDETFKADGTFDESKWKACEVISLSVYDREENVKAGGIDFSPSTSPKPVLCKEANVITFKNSKVLGSLNLTQNIDDVFTNGWISLGLWETLDTGFVNHALTTTVGGVAYLGLPVTGFAVEKYVNGNVGGVLSNYGGSFVHKYRRDFGGTVAGNSAAAPAAQ